MVAAAAHADHGEILVDGDGRTLYMFDQDSRGDLASACTDGCADAWPPLTAEADPAAGDGVTADLDTFARGDGATQVAAGGWPLYYFAEDDDPGDAAGHGVNDAWWVLAPDGTPKRPESAAVQVDTHPAHGDILVDGAGRTLYMFDSDTQGNLASTCTDGCAEAWPPLTTAGTPQAGEGLTADLTTFEREDGTAQVAANGWPLYYFADDDEPGDATGQGVNEAWWVLGPDGAPKRPAQATVAVREHPEYGDVLVDGDGMTLYMFDQDETDPPASVCSGGCASTWPPLTTEAEPTVGEAVTAAIDTFEREDGATQVAAGGWPLYGYASDTEPGDATGQGANDVWWVLAPDGTPQRATESSGSNGGGSDY